MSADLALATGTHGTVQHVQRVMAGCTKSSERCELNITPANYPVPVADLPGCVHLVNASKLAAVKNAFSFGQWGHECEQYCIPVVTPVHALC